MKRATLFAALLLVFAFEMSAQCGAKGMKAIDAKDYAGAAAAFEDCLQSDPNDISAQFGMSRLYGMDPVKKDMHKALEYLKQAEAGWAKLDEKGRGKYEKFGINQAEMDSRRSRVEASFLEAAKAKNTVQGYDDFLISFPNATSTTVCRNYRNDLAYQIALKEGSVEALDEYLGSYPDAENAKDVTKVRDERATAAALDANTEEALTHFIQHYPTALQAPQIKQRLNAVAFENAKAANTVVAFQNYIARFPESVFHMQATERLDWLQAQEQK